MDKAFSCLACLLLSVLGASCGGAQTDGVPGPGTQISFQQDVMPLLQQHCTGCHGGGSFLPLGSYPEIMQEREGVRTVVPGSPDASQLVQVVAQSRMPKMVQGFHAPMKERMLEVLRLWIAQGAKDN